MEDKRYKNELSIKALFVKNFKRISRSDKNQEVTAEALGVSVDTIAKWRNKNVKTIPQIDSMVAICNYYNCDPCYLFERDRDSFSLEHEEISKMTGLRSPAIATLEKEKSDHRRIVLLNLILSDRAVFESLMDCLFSLCWPSGYLLNAKKSDLISYPVKNPDGTIDRDHIAISPKAVKMLGSETPDNIYSKMRQIMEAFRKAVPDWSSACEDIIIEDKDEDEDEDADHGSVSGRTKKTKKDKQPVENK